MAKTAAQVEPALETNQPVAAEPALEPLPRGRTPLQPARRAAAPMPPPNGMPSAMRAARVIGAPGAATGSVMRAGMMNGLQAATGNARAGRLAVQAKLAVNQPGDAYEREADHVAATVMRMSAPRIPATLETTEPPPAMAVGNGVNAEGRVDRVAASGGSPAVGSNRNLETQLRESKGQGVPLPDATRAEMEPAFGADFSDVRIHTGPDAAGMSQGIDAQAFTHGADIYFDDGKYDPESASGKHLLAHELTHTVQQGGAPLKRVRDEDAVQPHYLGGNTPDIQAAWYNFHIPFTDYSFDPSVEGVKTAAGVAKDAVVDGATWVKDQVVAAAQWVFDRISDLVHSGIAWLNTKFAEIRAFATTAFQGIGNALTSGIAAIVSPLGVLQGAIFNMSADALSSAWNILSAGANGVWQTVKAVIAGLLSVGGGIWSTVSKFVDHLFGGVQSLIDNRVFRLLPQKVQDAAWWLFKTVRSLWESIRDFWTGFWKRLTALAQNVLASIERFVQRVASFVINEVIAVIRKLKEAFDLVKQFATDPEVVLTPIVQELAAKITTTAPGKASETAHQKIDEAIPDKQASSSTTTTVQRTPNSGSVRSTASRTEINTAVDKALADQWAKVVAVGVFGLVWDTIVKMFWPPATIMAIGHEFYELWNTDWANAVNGLFMPRNIVDNTGGFFHDLWSNFLVLLDFPLALWRRLNNILMLLMGYVTIILVLMGGGPGLALAFAIGEALLLSFLFAEGISVIKAVLDLYTADQTQAEKNNDYMQIAGSTIGIGIALALAAVFFVLSKLASTVAAFLKGAKGELPPGEKPPADTTADSSGESKTGDADGADEKPATAEPPKVIDVESPAQLRASEPVYKNGRWEWTLYDAKSGAVFCEVFVEAPSPTGRPAGGPRLTLEPKNATLPDGTKVTLKANGFSWTPESLKLAVEAFKKKFGAAPLEMGGEIDWANLANFQWEYAQIRAANPGMAPETIGAQAAGKISFGAHRLKTGYGDLRAKMTNFGDVEVTRTVDGTPQKVQLHDVPRDVYIEAKPTPGNPGGAGPTGGSSPSGGTGQ